MLKKGGLTGLLERSKNLHDLFVTLDGAIEIAFKIQHCQNSCISKMAHQKRCWKGSRGASPTGNTVATSHYGVRQ